MAATKPASSLAHASGYDHAGAAGVSADKATAKPFLTARWEYLVMANFVVDPAILQPHLPQGCQFDFHHGQTFLSVVGFMFLDTRVLGCRIPFHRNFPEVNLRFYVQRETDGEMRRGVAFIKEIVPRRAVTFVARNVYHENYVTHRMQTDINAPETGPANASYRWHAGGRWHEIAAGGVGPPLPAAADSEEQFITEHYWGYSTQPDGGTLEYRVEHPSWNIWPTPHGKLDCDVAAVYGKEFAEPLSQPPSSAFLVDGTAVTVYRGQRIK